MTIGATAKPAKKSDTRKLTTTTTSSTASRGPSPVATLKPSGATPSDKDVKSVTVMLTQASGTDSQSSIDRVINSIVDDNVLSLNGIAQFLLSSPNERSVILMQALNRISEKSGEN